MKSRYHLLAVATALASVMANVSVARADILFIDLNNGIEEITAARKAAALRHEKLVVIPARTNEEEKLLVDYHTLDLQLDQIREKYLNSFRKLDNDRTKISAEVAKPHPDQSVIAKLNAEISALHLEGIQADQEARPQITAMQARMAALGVKTRFKLDELKALLETREKIKAPFETVIISGHHDFNSITGDLGSVQKKDITDAFKVHEDLACGVKSMFGWGCYSVDDATHEWWWNSLPCIQLIGGLDASAPRSDRPANVTFLSNLLAQEANIRKLGEDAKTAHDVKQIAQIARAVPGFKDLNGAICTRAICVGMNIGAEDTTTANSLCTQKDLQAIGEVAARAKALLGQAGSGGVTENIPCDTQTSWLRSYYNNLRLHQHCGIAFGPFTSQFLTYTRDADSIIRLIDLRDVYDNYRAYYRQQIAKFLALPAACSIGKFDPDAPLDCAPPPELNKTGKEISRKQFLAFLETLNTSPCLREAAPVAPASPASAAPPTSWFGALLNRWWGTPPGAVPAVPDAVRNLLATPDRLALRSSLHDLDQVGNGLSCVPLSWVNEANPGQAIDPPKCN